MSEPKKVLSEPTECLKKAIEQDFEDVYQEEDFPKLLELYPKIEPLWYKIVNESNSYIPFESINDVKISAMWYKAKIIDRSDGNEVNGTHLIFHHWRTPRKLFGITFTHVSVFVCWVYYKYPNLHYSKLKDQIFDEKDEEPTIGDQLMNILPKTEQIKFDYHECSVCLEPTCSVLRCKHHLCKQCEGQMRKLECPLCREVFYDSESDDENVPVRIGNSINDARLIVEPLDDDGTLNPP